MEKLVCPECGCTDIDLEIDYTKLEACYVCAACGNRSETMDIEPANDKATESVRREAN